MSRLFLDPNRHLLTCTAVDCEGCALQCQLQCHFSGRDLLRFFGLPFRQSSWGHRDHAGQFVVGAALDRAHTAVLQVLDSHAAQITGTLNRKKEAIHDHSTFN